MTPEESYLLTLVRAGMLSLPPAPPREDLDWEQLFRLSEANSVSALAAEAALQMNHLPDKARTQAEVLLNVARYIEAMRYYEISELIRHFEEAGIDYCLLKGWHWCDLYPQPYLRDMKDVDILIRLNGWTKAREIALAQGFVPENEIDVHAALKKGEVKLELHRSLQSSQGMNEEYYEKIWERLEGVGNTHEWRMTFGDEYLYFFIHAEKHVSCYTFSLRTLTDIYVLRRMKGLNGGRIGVDREAEMLGIKGFIKNMESLSDALMRHTLSLDQTRALAFLMSLIHQTEDEWKYRRARRWLQLNLSPKSLFYHLFLPKELLAARYDTDHSQNITRHHIFKTVETYYLNLLAYFKRGSRIPRSRRKQLNQDMDLMYRAFSE